MIFSKLLPEVISNHIFPFLQLNDLLRLRRVCTESKILAEEYLRLHGTSDRIIEIDLRKNSFDDMASFLSIGFTVPVSKFNLQNKDNTTFEIPEMQTFLNLYGDKITYLKLLVLEIPIYSQKTREFFEALPNLKYLKVKHLLEDESEKPPRRTKRSRNQIPIPVWKSLPDLRLPSTFKRLQGLHMRHYECSSTLQSVQLLWKLLDECSNNLEFIYHPDIVFTGMGHDPNLASIPGGAFGCVKRMIERRHQERPSYPNLKQYDLKQHFSISSNVRDFYELVSTCVKFNVKLLNVDAELIEKLLQLETMDMADHGKKISKVVSSLHFLHTSSFLLEYPLVEKIFIGEVHGTALHCSMPAWKFERQPWQSLKELKIFVDSETLGDNPNDEEVETSRLLDFFFKGIRRENMETLLLSFFPHHLRPYDILPFPKIGHVCSTCPNLKKLTFYGWPGSNKAISKLWDNLPVLEELTFENCQDLGNAAFIGKDPNNPLMLKMTSLKSFTLDGLHKMPKITDTLFQLALRRMPLKKLYLKSETYEAPPLTSITVAGIASLLVGDFAKNVEKLELKILLENVTSEELSELGKLFRSSKMM